MQQTPLSGMHPSKHHFSPDLHVPVCLVNLKNLRPPGLGDVSGTISRWFMAMPLRRARTVVCPTSMLAVVVLGVFYAVPNRDVVAMRFAGGLESRNRTSETEERDENHPAQEPEGASLYHFFPKVPTLHHSPKPPSPMCPLHMHNP